MIYLLNNFLNYNIFSYNTENKQFYHSISNSFKIVSKLVYVLIMKYFTYFSLIFMIFIFEVTTPQTYASPNFSNDTNWAMIFGYSNIISNEIRLLRAWF